jgi:hypothetical protein
VNCYPFIEAEKAGDHNVKRACELLGVSRSAYYTDRTSGPSRRDRRDAELTAKIIEIHDESKHTYGSPRVHRELRGQGRWCSRKRVVRLMQAADRYGRVPKRWKKTTTPDPAADRRPDLIGRDLGIEVDQPGQLDTRWCGDITYIHTWQGWLYLATVIDLASRRVVGWAVADHLRTDLVAAALTNAMNRRRPAPGVVFHSDRGCQTGLHPVRHPGRGPGRDTVGRPPRPVLGQRRGRVLLRDPEDRTHPPPPLAHPPRGHQRDLRLHRGLVQHPPTPLHPRLPQPRHLRIHHHQRRPGSVNQPHINPVRPTGSTPALADRAVRWSHST